MKKFVLRALMPAALSVLMATTALAVQLPPLSDSLTAAHVQLTAGSLQSGGGPKKVRKCTNTYHPGGIRCTTCTYSSIGETSVKCIKLNTGS